MITIKQKVTNHCREIFISLTLFCISCFFNNQASSVVVWYPLPQDAYTFGDKYPHAQRLLFAFDYGHALVYERLLEHRGRINDPEKFERELLQDILTILRDPPTVKVDEEDIAPEYVFNFPLTVNVFDWSHMLHQFVLDVMSKPLDRNSAMVTRIKEINDQYNANRALRLADECKTMLFMDGHYFSKSFRRTFPSFNLLIWSYHWFQIKLYEDLMEENLTKRDAMVDQTVKEFWKLLSDLPDSADFDMMPETFVIAPKFSRLFPTIAASFDNNHMLHDIVSDILTSSKVLEEKIKAEGMRFTRMAQNAQAFAAVRCPL